MGEFFLVLGAIAILFIFILLLAIVVVKFLEDGGVIWIIAVIALLIVFAVASIALGLHYGATL